MRQRGRRYKRSSNILKIILIIFIGLILLGLIIIRSFFSIKPEKSFINAPELSKESFVDSHKTTESSSNQSIQLSKIDKTSYETISFDTNLRQSSYDCGAYNMYWLLSALGKDVQVKHLVDLNQKKMIPRLGVVPEVLVEGLAEYNIHSKLRTFKGMNEETKTNTIKALLLADKPIILLVKRHGYLHYILLTGFEDDTIHFYDPMLTRDGNNTVDNNGSFAGNDSLSSTELIKLWDEVSAFGLYRNMAIIVYPSETKN